jgi:hypothetical protein
MIHSGSLYFHQWVPTNSHYINLSGTISKFCTVAMFVKIVRAEFVGVFTVNLQSKFHMPSPSSTRLLVIAIKR